MAIMTGLSGNEMFCLHQKGFEAGELVIGNSVYSMGFVGSLGAGLRTIAGGEVEQVTQIIRDGRENAFERMVKEAESSGAGGITGVSSELIWQGSNVEFLSIGSGIHHEGKNVEKLTFSSSANGQELYCQLDAGFMPLRFVFGNVAYSIGMGGGIVGGFRSLARGEVKEFSDVFNETRHRALFRITEEARQAGANAVLGIQTTILPVAGMQEMVMIGTASRHNSLPEECATHPITSDLTNEEMWNIVHMGYMPVQMVLGVSVYSLGFVGGLTSAFQSFVRGEIKQLSSLIYEARDNALRRIRADAELVGADDVVGIKTYVYDLGSGLIEFMAIGTAVKKMPGVRTLTPTLPAQAVIKDKDTFYNKADTMRGANLNEANT
ncbi:MAG: heavy metal-binding domain-containing protein [Fibrella sp.]|nr:heavy metal-binding domain-containing protein [Armatimonadota bacterium]